MCQVHGPRPRVACTECGAGFYEGDLHTCRPQQTFEEWDARLQQTAHGPTPSNPIIGVMHRAAQRVAAWPEWKRRSAFADEMRGWLG